MGTTHHTRERAKKRNQKFHAEQNSFKLHEKMNKIVLAFAIVVVGVIVDCGSSQRQNEDAVEREAIQELNDYLAGNKEVNDDELQQAINQLRPQRLKTMNGGTQVLREAEGEKREAGVGSWLLKKLAKKAFKIALRKLGPKILRKISGSGNIKAMLTKYGLGGYISKLGGGTVTSIVESMVPSGRMNLEEKLMSARGDDDSEY